MKIQGIVLDREKSDKIELREVALPLLGPTEVRVALKAAALNHRDEWCRQGLYPGLADGVILGSDGAGVVEAVGATVDPHWVGKEVIINPALDWGADEGAQQKSFSILGMPRHGTLATHVQVDQNRLHEKPEHLSWEAAAALPLAGLTAYRALMVQGGCVAGEQVLVTGFGGGVAQFAAQFALAAGAIVSTSSSSTEKLAKAREVGVQHTFQYTDEQWVKAALAETEGYHLIIDSAMGDTLAQLIKVARPGGRLVFYGATRGNPSGFDARKVFWSQLKLIGSTMGSDADFSAMLDFVREHRIQPVVDQVFGMEEAVEAFERMKAGAQLGKIVIRTRR
nr:zinc-binding dehydrogenase [Nitritalea halalkaliphila]